MIEAHREALYVSTIEEAWLVGGWTTHSKNMLVKLDHLPKDRGENSKNIWNHHADEFEIHLFPFFFKVGVITLNFF